MKNNKEKHYCDSCIFISFLNQQRDDNDLEACSNIILVAEQNHIELYTSAFTMSEVVYIKSDISENEQEDIINKLFSNGWIRIVQFEREISEINRYLVRKYKLTPSDALHVATAIRMRVDYFNMVDQKLIEKLPKEVCCPPHYPKSIIIQKPSTPQFQLPLF